MGAFYSRTPQQQANQHQQQQQQKQQLQLGATAGGGLKSANGYGSMQAHQNERGSGGKYDDNGTILSAAESLQLLSQQEMEHEFEKIYQRSHHLLQSLTHNPCEELSERIAQCLESNAKQMSNCFGAMEAYQACVAQESSDKLVRQ